MSTTPIARPADPGLDPLAASRPHRARPVLGWAWSIPMLVVLQFAMLAVLPVVIVVRRTWRDPSLRAVRPWATTLAAAYLVPLVLWALGPDRKGSLSKDMHPALAVVLVAVAAAYAVRVHLQRLSASRR